MLHRAWKAGDLGRAWRRLRQSGWKGTLAHAQRRLRHRLFVTPADQRFDTRMPMSTGRQHDLSELTVASGNLALGSSYEATPAAFLALLLKSLPSSLNGSVFVDFGSGKGRVLLLAAKGPFKQLVGVEFAEELHRAAVANVAHAGLENRISLVLGDAAEFEIPEEPCVLYFYNPFERPVLERVVENIRRSYERNRRPLYVVYYNPRHAEVFEGARFLSHRPMRLLERLRHRLLDIAEVRTYATAEAR